MVCVFFFQAEDGIRDLTVTGVQTCALPISVPHFEKMSYDNSELLRVYVHAHQAAESGRERQGTEIGRAACRGRGEISGGGVSLKKKKRKHAERLEYIEYNNRRDEYRANVTR